MADRPTIAFLFRHPAHFIALGAGSGLAPAAPGTFGTLAAIPLALLLRAHFGDAEFVAAIVILFVAGAWAAQVTGRDLGQSDDGAIVIDEIAAFLLVLFFVGADWVRVAVAFLVFRLFDIWKPPPIRQLDAAIKNGIGVMLDDLLAAAYTLVVFALWQRAVG
jgi:phosphatidylglycerophosphatase A